MTNKEFANQMREFVKTFNFEDDLRTQLNEINVELSEDQIQALIGNHEAHKFEPCEVIENAKNAEEAINAHMTGIKSDLDFMHELVGNELYNKITQLIDYDGAMDHIKLILNELAYC